MYKPNSSTTGHVTTLQAQRPKVLAVAEWYLHLRNVGNNPTVCHMESHRENILKLQNMIGKYR